MAKSIRGSLAHYVDFWPLVFGVNKLVNNKEVLITPPTSELTCPGSLWEFFKNVNEAVLSDVQNAFKSNPGCAKLVKCELAHYTKK